MKDRTRHDLVLLSDQLPPDEHARDGRQPSPDSLLPFLRPLIAERDGAWVGRPDFSATVAGLGPDGIRQYPVDLVAEEVTAYFDGQCLAAIEPLYHDAVEPSTFHRHWRAAYRAVNRRYAEIAAQVANDGAIVWVHDYHLQLVPNLLRRLRPDLLIGFTMYLPFPPPELFRRMPLRGEIVDGLLGADLLCFQQARDVANFMRVAGQGADRHGGRINVDGRQVDVGVFPAMVDADAIEARAQTTQVRERARAVRAALGHPKVVLLAVDVLQPAAGIGERLTAFAEVLRERPSDAHDMALIQVVHPHEGSPSPRHDGLRASIERTVAQINGEHAEVGRPAVHYLHQTLDPDELAALYCDADVMLSTPLCAGSQLSAMRFVASRTGESGVLVLSESSGAGDQLCEAMIVNPYDIDEMKAAIVRAAQSGPEEHRAAMSAMRGRLKKLDLQSRVAGFLTAVGTRAATASPQSFGPALGAEAGGPVLPSQRPGAMTGR